MIVLLVVLEVLSQVDNALCQNGNLDFRRTGIAWLGRIIQRSLPACVQRLSTSYILSFEEENRMPTAGMSSSGGRLKR